MEYKEGDQIGRDWKDCVPKYPELISFSDMTIILDKCRSGEITKERREDGVYVIIKL